MAGVGSGLAVLNFPPVAPPQVVNQLLQVAIGLFVGLRITRNSLASGVRSLAPALLLATLMLAAGVLAALLSVWITRMDLRTALFAAAPGGITEMSTVASALGADGAAVTTVHLIRLLLAIAVVGILTRGSADRNPETRPLRTPLDEASLRVSDTQGNQRWLGLAVLTGSAAGILGLLTPVPAGGVIGALLGSAAFRLLRPGPPARGLRTGVQVLAGAVIGLKLSDEFFGQLADLVVASSMIVGMQTLVWLASYRLLSGFFGYESATAVFASAPGGMSELISGADQAGASTSVVAFTHLVRLSATICIVPSLADF